MQADIPLEIKEIFCGCGGKPTSHPHFNVYEDGALVIRTTVYSLPLTKYRRLIAAPGEEGHYGWSLHYETAVTDRPTAEPVLVWLCDGSGIDSEQLLQLCNLLEGTQT